MYKASLIIKGDKISASIKDDDDSNSIAYMIPMDIEEAKLLRIWLNGMSITIAPIEFRVGKSEYFLHYNVWHPLRETINNWYEVNYASV